MKSFFVVLFFLICQNSFAANVKKFWVPVSNGREVYVEYHSPAPGKPTIVLLHGLTYTTVQWAQFITELEEFGYGVICYDMQGMGKTLLRYAPIQSTIALTDQINDLGVLLNNIKLKKPYNLLGLSYGGGVAFGFAFKHPEAVAKLILFAPYTKPSPKTDVYLNQQVSATRLMYPFNPYSDRQLYEFFFRQAVYANFPLKEPIVLENPYKLEAVFRLAFGTNTFIPEEHAAEMKVPTHLFIAENDQYFPREQYEHFWSLFPASSKKNFFVVKNSEHKIPESQPLQAAKLLQSVFE